LKSKGKFFENQADFGHAKGVEEPVLTDSYCTNQGSVRKLELSHSIYFMDICGGNIFEDINVITCGRYYLENSGRML
jgi:hypothetical protein